MGIPKGYFKNIFSKLKIEKNAKGYAVYVSFERLGKRLDYAQDVLDAQVWADMQQYMPIDTGTLIAETDRLNKSTRGEVYVYPPGSDYGHYQYEGILYIDPVYKKGAFYSDDYGYWSRPGVTKIPSDRPLFYQNPKAEAHWDEVAYQNHSKQWVKVAKEAFSE